MMEASKSYPKMTVKALRKSVLMRLKEFPVGHLLRRQIDISL